MSEVMAIGAGVCSHITTYTSYHRYCPARSHRVFRGKDIVLYGNLAGLPDE